jgi:hypothetical protein
VGVNHYLVCEKCLKFQIAPFFWIGKIILLDRKNTSMCIKNAHRGTINYSKREEEEVQHSEPTNSVTNLVVVNLKPLPNQKAH